ncbi:MAG: DNA phosphorothioation system sulfurtransferase DndC, partial [Colwellia sp.]
MNKQETLYKSMDEMLAATSVAGRPLPDLIIEIQNLYLEDTKPWVIGFSGGKDSTTILSLIYVALQKLKKSERHKHIYVVSSDTLVETPMVVDMVDTAIDLINKQAKKSNLPMSAHIVRPKMNQTFWANLLGKGYPAPTQNFRWCTERMKIDPVSEFILDKVTRFGQVVVVLGARSDESASRAQVIAKHKIEGSTLSRHSSLPGAFTYMPIEDWSFDDVWMYLLGAPAPWGGDHFELFELYKDSSAGECPLVIDTKTPSCGNSRFGCWTCTVVTKDRAMEGLIES